MSRVAAVADPSTTDGVDAEEAAAVPDGRRLATTLAGLAGLVVVSALRRLEGQKFPLWSDEGISLGIASHRLADIPTVLRLDGSPPSYYLLLHGWTRWWGDSATAVRSLSLLLALAAIPVSYWAGKSLFGRRAGWMAAVLAATSPYLTLHSREARMYTLVVVLSLVAAAAFTHGFVLRERRWLPAFVASTALLVHTHNWGVFFVVGTATAAAWCAVTAGPQRRAQVVDSAIAFVAVGALCLPWMAVLVDQVAHTGAPWSRRPAIGAMVVALGSVLGGVAVAAVVLAGLVPLARAVRRQPALGEHRGAVALAVVVLATLGAAWSASQVEPAWSPRYTGVVLGPLLLLVALALARAGRAGVVGVAVVAVLSMVPLGRAVPKSNVETVAQQVAGVVRPGDVVMSTQMEQVPLLRHELGPNLRYADPTGLVDDPRVADWRDAFDRLSAADPAAVLAPLVEGLAEGGHVMVVCPRPSATPDDLAWYRLMDSHCEAVHDALSRTPGLTRVLGPFPDPSSAGPGVSVVASVYERSVAPR